MAPERENDHKDQLLESIRVGRLFVSEYISDNGDKATPILYSRIHRVQTAILAYRIWTNYRNVQANCKNDPTPNGSCTYLLAPLASVSHVSTLEEPVPCVEGRFIDAMKYLVEHSSVPKELEAIAHTVFTTIFQELKSSRLETMSETTVCSGVMGITERWTRTSFIFCMKNKEDKDGKFLS